MQRLPAGADPREPVARALETWEERAAAVGVHTAVLAVDPRHWETVLFTLGDRTPPSGVLDPDRYEVLHVSAPHLAEVPVGRQWR